MKRVLVYMLAGMALVGTSCSDFLDTIPHDALSPSTTWQTEKDAEKFLIGCYDGWADETVFCIGIVLPISVSISMSMKIIGISEMVV